MIERIGKFASALVVVMLTGAVSAISFNTAHAGDDCLAKPKDSTPAGKHWYYRVDHRAKRNCWYLAEEGRRTSQAASLSAKVADPQPETIEPSVANARAELTDTAAGKIVNAPAMTAPAAIPQQVLAIPQQADASLLQPGTIASARTDPPQDDDTKKWALAGRWPDPSQTSRAVDPAPAIAAHDTPASQPARQQNAVVAPPAVAAPEDDPSDTLRMLLGALTAGLVLAAIVGRLMIVRMRRAQPPRRRPIWNAVDDRGPRPQQLRTESPQRRTRVEDLDDLEIERLLLRAARREYEQAMSPTASAARARMPRGRSDVRA